MEEPSKSALYQRERRKKKISDETLMAARYLQEGKNAGCPADQMANFYKAGIFLQPKQLQFAAAARECDKPDGPTAIGLGGSRGPGKTHGIIAQMGADDCQRFPGLKVLFLRKVAKANKEQFNDFRIKLFGNIPNTYRSQDGELLFENGSKIIIGHFKDERDIDNYLGLEYDLIAIEELTTLSFEKWKNVMSCLRTSKPNWRPRSYASWNWGGVGHAWAKDVFWNPMVEGTEKNTRFIKCTVLDNKFVNKEYREYLESLTGWKRKSWLEGDPNFQAGQFFTNWRQDVHVYPNEKTTFEFARCLRFFASFDHGFAHPACWHLHGEDGNGTIYTRDEDHRSETTIEEHSENFKDMLRRHGLSPEDLDFIAAGRDCFSRKPDGMTIAQEYENYGITLTPTEIDRVNAWAMMQERLGDTERGIAPSWFIHKDCVNLIQQIPLAQNNEKRPGDIVKMNADPDTGDGGDDAIECARNGLVSTPSTCIKFAKPLSVGRMYQMIGG